MNASTMIKKQLERHPNASKEILQFILTILYRNEAIANFFAAGYCYYFALMLKDAFGGEILWKKGNSHIVWADTHNEPYNETKHIVYDIYGVYEDYERGQLVPINNLKSDLESFRHRGHDFDVQYEVIDYQRKHNLNDYEINEMVFNIIPEVDRTFDYPNAGDTYRYWDEFKCKREPIER